MNKYFFKNRLKYPINALGALPGAMILGFILGLLVCAIIEHISVFDTDNLVYLAFGISILFTIIILLRIPFSLDYEVDNHAIRMIKRETLVKEILFSEYTIEPIITRLFYGPIPIGKALSLKTINKFGKKKDITIAIPKRDFDHFISLINEYKVCISQSDENTEN